MAKLKIEGFIDQLESELKKTLLSTLRKHLVEGTYNEKAIYKTFEKQLKEKCNSWEYIPNKYIKNN